MDIAQLLDILRCPDSGERLSLGEGVLTSSTSQYDIINPQLACFYPNGAITRLQWGSKIKQFLNTEREHLKKLQQLAQNCEHASSRKRISLQHEARHKNLAVMQKMLASWIPDNSLPLSQSTQQIESYFELFFRDWCWGDELRPYAEYCTSAVATTGAERILVLGSGAGGLSYHLANAQADSAVISIEHNPFLALASSHIMQGKSLKLHEYSLYPSKLENSSKKWEIKQPPLEHNNHIQLLATYPFLPFAEKSFDLIIAPWFFDILDIGFDDAVRASTQFLKAEGKLLFMGPANVHKPHYDEQYCSDEMRELFKRSFSSVETKQQTLPYLANPRASQSRMENVMFVEASGPSFASLSKEASPSDTLHYTPELQQYKLKTATIHQILSHIDQSITVGELADMLVTQFGFEESESAHYAMAFIAEIRSGITPD
ncbi:MAG: hypothetical protein AB8B48_08265 [Pseudomonadales bacterium]